MYLCPSPPLIFFDKYSEEYCRLLIEDEPASFEKKAATAWLVSILLYGSSFALGDPPSKVDELVKTILSRKDAKNAKEKSININKLT